MVSITEKPRWWVLLPAGCKSCTEERSCPEVCRLRVPVSHSCYFSSLTRHTQTPYNSVTPWEAAQTGRCLHAVKSAGVFIVTFSTPLVVFAFHLYVLQISKQSTKLWLSAEFPLFFWKPIAWVHSESSRAWTGLASDISMKIFSLQEKQQTMEGSAVFARFLKESIKDALCYKTAIHTPSRYRIRMLIKAKHRSAAPHSFDEVYSCSCFCCACKALCKRQKEISLHSQWDLYEW